MHQSRFAFSFFRRQRLQQSGCPSPADTHVLFFAPATDANRTHYVIVQKYRYAAVEDSECSATGRGSMFDRQIESTRVPEMHL